MTNPIRPGTRCVSSMLSFAAALLTAGAATAQETPTPAAPTPAAPTPAAETPTPAVTETPAPTTGAIPSPEGGVSLDLNVVARQLDIARSEIQPSLGATVYDL